MAELQQWRSKCNKVSCNNTGIQQQISPTPETEFLSQAEHFIQWQPNRRMERKGCETRRDVSRKESMFEVATGSIKPYTEPNEFHIMLQLVLVSCKELLADLVMQLLSLCQLRFGWSTFDHLVKAGSCRGKFEAPL